MIPVRLELEGFMSYRDPQVLDFEGASLWMLSGDNGAGKSAVFDAITYVLFDTVRGLKTHHADLINHGRDKMTVTFDFRLGSRQFRAIRSLGHDRSTTRQVLEFIPGGDPKGDPILSTHSDSGFDAWIKEHVGQTYDSFVTSVLLQQGQSERLLQLKPAKRYETFAELIDLSRYQRLHELADGERRNYQAQAEALKQLLGTLKEITAEELLAAGKRVEILQGEQAKAHIARDRAQDVRDEAAKWVFLSGRLTVLIREIEAAQRVLSREKEIETQYARLSVLDQVIPAFRTVLRSRARLAEIRKRLAELGKELAEFSQPYTDARSLAREQQDQETEIRGEITRLGKKHVALLTCENELSLTSASVRQIVNDRVTLANLQKEIQAFAADLDECLREAETAEEKAARSRQAIHTLELIAETQGRLTEVTSQREEQIHQRTDLKKKKQELEGRQRDSREELRIALQQERDTGLAAGEEKTRLKSMQEREEEFRSVAAQPTCPACGQEITAEHVVLEQGRIAKELERLQEALALADGVHQKATEKRQEIEAALGKLDLEIRALDRQIAQFDGQISSLAGEAQDTVGRLLGLYRRLDAEYQAEIVQPEPQTVEQWLAVHNPTEFYLSAVRTSSESLETWQTIARRLRGQAGLRDQKADQAGILGQNIQLMEQQLPEGWETASDDLQKTKGERENLSKKIDVLNEQAGSLAEALAITQQAVDNFSDREEGIAREIERLNGELEAVSGHLDATLGQLPSDWKGTGEQIDADGLKLLEEEGGSLSGYTSLHSSLEVARHNAGRMGQEREEIDQQIAAIPEDSRLPEESAKEKWRIADEYASSVDGNLRSATQEEENMRKMQALWAKNNVEYLRVDRLWRSFQTLAEALSEKGIQKAVLRTAEKTIVEYANEILDGLSGGRCKLLLRAEDETKKALDLEILDHEMGNNNPIPVELASGSQRFRVAASLALAIGRYVRRDSHRVESVIIDEGFGALDQAGREDAIQELIALRGQLERIIIVSHQEEFAARFPNGYRIVIQNGASIVRDV